MSRTIVVTGTDTGIGKTVFSAALAGAINGYYWKPIQSGLDGETDSEIVARLSGLPAERILPEAYRLATPCSPHQAAAIDGVRIDMKHLTLPLTDRPLVVEGAGGALVPLDDETVFADLFRYWGEPIVIVARTALGTINHSLLTIEALRARNLLLHGIVFVGEAMPETERVICKIGQIDRLGRLDPIENLTPETLAEAFNSSFDVKDFVG